MLCPDKLEGKTSKDSRFVKEQTLLILSQANFQTTPSPKKSKLLPCEKTNVETLTILWLIPVGCTKLFNDFLFLGFNHSRGALSQLTEERRGLCAVPWGFRTHSVEKEKIIDLYKT